MIELVHPWFLLLLAAVPVVLALGWRGLLAEMSARQRRVCFALRSVILALLALALCGARLRTFSRKLAVLFVVDQSASITPDGAKQARDFIAASLPHAARGSLAGVVGFAGSASVLQPPSASQTLASAWAAPAQKEATDIAGALAFASALFPPDAARRVVLLSDGNDTEGRAAQAARELAAQGIELDAVPLRNPRQPEVLVERIDAPQRAKQGEPFDVEAVIRSNVETKATVRLSQNGFVIARQETALKTGANRVAFKSLTGESGMVSYECEVSAAADTRAENNRAQAAVSIRGEPRVLIVETDEAKAAPLAEALRAGHIAVETRAARGAPAGMEDLQQFDLLILSDVSALALSRAQMDLFQGWVRDFGGGFAMLGGENSFGVGGYFKTPVEQMLPVRMEHDDREETPTVAMLIVLDRSGSMAAQVSGQTKIALADQGAAYALDVLQPRDLFGVMAVDTRIHNVAPLGRVEDKAATGQKILSITSAGGGIYIYTSLAEAYRQLRDASAKIKHVILFSDAADAEEKSAGEMADGTPSGGSALDLAAAMLAQNITLSVVGLGQETDKDTEFLRQLAERGNGRFYLTNDALSLPRIFSTETLRVAQSSLVEEPFSAVPAAKNAPAIAGIDWPQSPLLLGYNATKPKPGADVLLATERGDPLLATWRYGLGQTAAWTSDAKARWAAEWLAWPGFGKFWSQLVRSLMRKNDPSGLAVATSQEGGRLTLHIDAVAPDGSFRDGLPITVHCVKPSGEALSQAAEQEAPGRYSARFELPSQGTLLFSVNAGTGGEGYDFGITRPYPVEFLTADLNESALRELAGIGGGKYAPGPADVFAPPAAQRLAWRDLTPWFLCAALLLFPLDIWLRRRAS